MPFRSRGGIGLGLGGFGGFVGGLLPSQLPAGTGTGAGGVDAGGGGAGTGGGGAGTPGGGGTGGGVGTPVTGAAYTTTAGSFITDSDGNVLVYANPYVVPNYLLWDITPLDSGAVWAP